jgi:tetratricopeptide (TPR) repeat protein
MNDYVETFQIINDAVDDKNYEFALKELLKLADVHKDEHPINIKFVSTLRLGEIYLINLKDFDKSLPYLMKSYTLYERIEGLIYLVKFYFDNDRLLFSYALACVCLFTKEFEGAGCDKYVYEFERYFLMGKICLKMQKYEEANDMIKLAIKGIGDKGQYSNIDDETYDKLIVELREIFEASATGMMTDKPE